MPKQLLTAFKFQFPTSKLITSVKYKASRRVSRMGPPCFRLQFIMNNKKETHEEAAGRAACQPDRQVGQRSSSSALLFL